MSIKRSCFIVGAVVLLASVCAQAEFWYGVDGPEQLQIDSLKVTLQLYNGYSPDELEEGLDRIVGILDDQHVPDLFLVCSLATPVGYDAFLDSLVSLPAVKFVEPYYQLASGTPMLVGAGFCVAFEEDVSQDQIDSINGLYGAVIDHELTGMPNVFALKNTDSSGYRLVELANTYYNRPETRYAHPDFSAVIATNSYQLHDYYADYQPHTKKVIGEFNQASVWDFTGLERQITVAVIDDGVTSHEDLPANRVISGYDFAGGYPDYERDNDPSPGDSSSHGMACAGIVGASHTTDSATGLLSSSGVISLNPNTLIMPVKIFTDSGNATGVTVSDLADAVGFARMSGADILANSWSFTDPDSPDEPVLNDALERAYLFGRGGRGCPIVFSSGNTYPPWFTDPNGVAYPSRLDVCFAVGATTLGDSRWSYSRYGPELDMVAPSDDGLTVGVWSLDQMGNLGQNPSRMTSCPPGSNDTDYNCKFSGTSAASPVVSGTASLLLAKDSTLSSQAVYYILRNSAVTDLDWGSITPPDNQYGYGRVDAFRAILSISHGNIDNLIGPAGPDDVSDLTYFVAYLYTGGSDPFPSVQRADVDCDGEVNVADLTYYIDFLFTGGPGPVKPCFEF